MAQQDPLAKYRVVPAKPTAGAQPAADDPLAKYRVVGPPPSLTPESILGPVGDWLQANVQPRMERVAQAVRAASQRDQSGLPASLDIDSALRRGMGTAIGGAIQTLAHPVDNAETLAPIALELARLHPAVRGATSAASALRGMSRATPVRAGAQAVLQGAERSALAGGAGAGIAAADSGEPVWPAMQAGALRQGVGDLIAGGIPLAGGAGARMIGRSGGYNALDPNLGSLTSVWLAEGKPAREFTESRAKRLVKDLMTHRSKGRIGGDAYFDNLRMRTNQRETAREAMFDSTRDAKSGLPLGEYAVGLRDVATSVRPTAQRAARLDGFAPEAAAQGIQATGQRFLRGREGINLSEIQAADIARSNYQRALQGQLPTPARQAYQEALARAETKTLPIPAPNKLEQLRRAADAEDAAYVAQLKAGADTAETAATTAFDARWAPGTAPGDMRELPLDLKNSSEILRSMDRTQAADLQRFMADVQGKAEFNPTPKQKGQSVLRDTLNNKINDVAPDVAWEGSTVPYRDFRRDYAKDISWRDMAGQAGGSGSVPRARAGFTMSGRPFAHIGEGIETVGGAVARPLISRGEQAMRGASRAPAAARLAWLLAHNQPDDVQITPQPFQVNLQDLLNRIR